MTLAAPLAAFASTACHTANSLIKRGVLRVPHVKPLSYAVAYHLSGAALLLLPVLLFYPPVGVAVQGWALALLSSALWFGQALLGFGNIKAVEAPRLAVLKRFKLIFLVLLAVLFLGEELTFRKGVSLALVLGGALVLTYDPAKVRVEFDSRTLKVIAAALLSAAALVVDKTGVGYFPLPAYAFIQYFVPGVLLVAWTRGNPLAHFANLAGFRKWLAADVVLEVGGYALLLYALKHGSAINAALITELALPLTALGGILILGERRDWKRVLLATCLSLAGGVIALV